MSITKKQTNSKLPSRGSSAAVSSMSQVAKSKPSYSHDSRVENQPLAMGKMNYILMGVSLLLIVVGFVMMSGSSNVGDTFNDDVFSSTRIVVAPLITFIGFLCMVPAILYNGRKDDDVPQPLNVINKSAAAGNVIVNGK